MEPRQLLTTVALGADADIYTRSDASAGAAANLDVRDLGGDDFVAYVRFDLSGITDTITSASLKLHETAGSRNDAITNASHQLYGLTSAAGNTPQNWSESSDLNPGGEYDNNGGDSIDLAQVFNLDPEQGANVTETISGTDDVDVITSGPDLVTFLNQRANDGGLVTFIVAIDADSSGYGFASRENSDSGLRPQLTIEYGQPDPYPENPVRYTHQVEDLDRGVIAMRKTSLQVYVGWRMLATDPADVSFNLYRSTGGGPAVKLNSAPLTQTTDYLDSTANLSSDNTYFVRPIIQGIELAPSDSYTLAASSPIQQFLSVPLQIPAGGTTPLGDDYTYEANDASVGDLDGDGDYEILLKWEPTNKTSYQGGGYTGNTYFDAYTLEGDLLWRIDLGINVRSGSQTTQILVYDFDGDGRSEVVLRTAPGTVDGLGNDVILPGDDPNADYREPSGSMQGTVISGPEYLTVFDGLTGGELATIDFPLERQTIDTWGDNYANRSDRYMATVAYLDGMRPSMVWTRGIYGPAAGYTARNEQVALDWRDGQLTQRWRFNAVSNGANSEFVGEGAQSLSVADVDGDGFDEIVYGAAVVDHDGTLLYATGLGHGDALHVSDMVPSNPGLEIYMPHESATTNGNVGASLRDAMTGEIISSITASGDIGRGVAADIDPTHPGYEYWAVLGDPAPGGGPVQNAEDGYLYQAPGNMFTNFVVWWDADLTRELLDRTTISEWNYTTAGRSNFDLDPGSGGLDIYAPGASDNNDTKHTPALSVDIFGDWREEVIWRASGNTELRIFTTIIPANNRLVTLMHDRQYREAIAWQNVGYNQPPHPSFFLGAGMDDPPVPDVYLASAYPAVTGDFDLDRDVDADDLGTWSSLYGATQAHGYLPGDADGNQAVNGNDFLAWQRNYGLSAASNTAPTIASPAAALPDVVVGTTTELSVLGDDDAGESALAYSWSSNGPAAVSYSDNGTNDAKDTTVTFTAAGEYTFTVTVSDVFGETTTSQVTVTVDQTLSSIVVDPDTSEIVPSDSLQLTATAADQFGNVMISQPTFVWSVTSGGGTVSPAGLYTAPGIADLTSVEASASGLADSASITVTTDIATLAWWKLDETSGTAVADSSGNGLGGTTVNGPNWVSGQFDNALDFDGSNDYVELPASIVSSTAGTVSMWIKTGVNFSDAAHLFYMSPETGGNGGGAETELHVNFLNTERIQFFIEGGSSDVNIVTAGTYANNAWHHVAATWDIDGDAILYVDGSVVGSQTHNAGSFTGSAVTRLGRPGPSVRYYNGLMDDVRLFDYAISPAHVQALYSEASSAVAASATAQLDAAFALLGGLRQSEPFVGETEDETLLDKQSMMLGPQLQLAQMNEVLGLQPLVSSHPTVELLANTNPDDSSPMTYDLALGQQIDASL